MQRVVSLIFLKVHNILVNSWGIPKDIQDLVLDRDKRCVYCGCEFGAEKAKKKSWEHIINDININTLPQSQLFK